MATKKQLIPIDTVLVGIATFKKCYEEAGIKPWILEQIHTALQMVERFVKEIPAVDAVEVIRCKNCEHSRRWGNEGTLLCYRDKTTIHIVKPDAYCDGSQRRYAADDPDALKFEPVLHGRWESVNSSDVRCSNCGFEWFAVCQECGVSPDNTHYCPNCGAKMDGGTDNA